MMIVLASDFAKREISSDPVSLRPTDGDTELLERCRQELPKKLDAFSELVARYESSVFETAERLTGDVDTAEQICEDAFMQIFHQIYGFETEQTFSRFRVWLFQIVHRLCDLHCEIGSRPESDPRDEMGWVLSKLTPTEKTWMVFRFVTGLHANEIAKILEIGDAEAKPQLWNALNSFRQACDDVKVAA